MPHLLVAVILFIVTIFAYRARAWRLSLVLAVLNTFWLLVGLHVFGKG